MASAAPLMPFLRPLGLPRPSTVRQFLRVSSNFQCRAVSSASAQIEDKNLIASRNASPSYPPPNMPSNPRPKVSRASRRTSHPPKERSYPTRGASHRQVEVRRLNPEPVEFLSEELCAPNLPYYVSRTVSHELPIYEQKKRGGNLHLTVIKKIDGSIQSLRSNIVEQLQLDEKHAVINDRTKQLVIKGHHKRVIEKYLRERKF